MPRHWIERNTTANDLLDDGVENFSDVRSMQGAAEETGKADPAAVVAIQRTRDAAKAEALAEYERERRRAWSPFGVALGLAMSAAGSLLIRHPADMLLYRYAMTYWSKMPTRPFVEHVTASRSVFYGEVVVGLAVVVFALFRPRSR